MNDLDQKDDSAPSDPQPEDSAQHPHKARKAHDDNDSGRGVNPRRRRGGDFRQPSKGGPTPFRGPGRVALIWLLVIFVSILGWQYLQQSGQDTANIGYSDFARQLDDGNITEVAFTNRDLEGRLREAKSFPGPSGANKVLKFRTTLPFDDNNYQVINKLQNAGVKVDVKESGPGYFAILLTLAPWVLIVFVWIFFMRQMQGAGGPKGIFSFGKSRARLAGEDRPKVTFADVAGCDEAKEELTEIIEFLKSPAKFQKLGGKIPKGALLLGAPGTGKTLLARAVAGEAGVPFFSMSGSDFVEMFVGVGASRVRDLFEQGKKNSPCIIFIDEIDAVGRHRGAGLGGGHDEREQTLNQLLVEMDGFEVNSGVIILAATNRPDVLDPALLRPGRFDRQIIVPLPDVRGREEILKVHAKKIKLAEGVDMARLGKATPGFSGADLANMINEGALLAARRNLEAVTMEILELSKDKVMMGAERRSLVITEKEKEMVAFHEAGHAVVAKYIEDADPVYKVTIIPRGRALGVTSYLPQDERYTQSKSSLEGRLAYAMGGRVAEKTVFGQVSTGAADDLDRSTELAHRMVCNWGMSDELGPVTFGKKEEQIFLGKEFGHVKNYSEDIAKVIDSEVRVILERAEALATRILGEHREVLDKVARLLLDKEIINGEEIDEIIAETEGPRTLAPSPVPA